MGDKIAHLTDMHARCGAFSDFTREGNEGGRMLKGQVAIIKRYASFGVAYSCDLNEINDLLPTEAADGSERLLDGFKRAYATCCHLNMHTLGTMSSNAGGSGVVYLFEAGDEHQNDSDRFISHATQRGPVLETYQYLSHDYFQKSDARLLETADVLAWEWAKHIDRTRQGLAMRPSLRAMMGEHTESTPVSLRTDKYYCRHLSGFELERFCSKVRQLLLATEIEEVRAIVAASSQDVRDHLT